MRSLKAAWANISRLDPKYWKHCVNQHWQLHWFGRTIPEYHPSILQAPCGTTWWCWSPWWDQYDPFFHLWQLNMYFGSHRDLSASGWLPVRGMGRLNRHFSKDDTFGSTLKLQSHTQRWIQWCQQRRLWRIKGTPWRSNWSCLINPSAQIELKPKPLSRISRKSPHVTVGSIGSSYERIRAAHTHGGSHDSGRVKCLCHLMHNWWW